MAAPPIGDLLEVINGIDSVEEWLERDVKKFCGRLKFIMDSLHEEGVDLCQQKHRNLKRNFLDIYMCLKLHLEFHFGADDEFYKKVLTLPPPLSDEPEVNTLSETWHAIDPGSKVLEILSAILHRSVARGTEEHADRVMIEAKKYFRRLGSNNIFQPKVLVKVSCNSVFSVGCSMAVSSFLRPLCLHNRIAKFKFRLREAVVLDSPLDPGDQNGQWSSSAFMRSNHYTEPKDPCRNCQDMFINLNGFIPDKVEAGTRDTFQGACAEYIPVNEMLTDDTRDRPTVAVQKKLEGNLERCMYLFRNYREITAKCCKCLNEDNTTLKNDPQLLNAAFDEIPHIRIFGFNPNLKM